MDLVLECVSSVNYTESLYTIIHIRTNFLFTQVKKRAKEGNKDGKEVDRKKSKEGKGVG